MKVLRRSVIVVLYILIGWGTALHYYRGEKQPHYIWAQRHMEMAVTRGIFWPVAGLYVWSDVYLWDADRSETQSSMSDTLEFWEPIPCFADSGTPLNPLERK